MNYEEKIAELEERIAKLEKIEKKRKTKMIISLCVKLVVFIVILILAYKLYLYVKPYFSTLNELYEFKNSLNLNGGGLGGFDINSLFGK